MRIGVISDTHLRSGKVKLPQEVKKGLAGVDLILHAGDWMTLELLPVIERIAPVEGVAGNNDRQDIISRFGHAKVLELGAYRVGIVHGHQGHRHTPLNAAAAFSGQHVDAVVFGHSHIPFNQTLNGVLLFNPGSPTDKRRQPQYSYGILRLDERIHGEIYYF